MIAWHEGADIRLVAAPMALYAVDTAWALIRRASRGERLTEAHKDHVYQQLTSGPRAMSHMKVSAAVAVVGLFITASWMWFPAPFDLLLTVALLGLYVAAPSLVRSVPTQPRFRGI